VLDLLLIAFENNLSKLCYLTLLKEFGSQNSITQIIGFKVQNTHTSSLMNLIALLLREQIILLEDIWPHICHE